MAAVDIIFSFLCLYNLEYTRLTFTHGRKCYWDFPIPFLPVVFVFSIVLLVVAEGEEEEVKKEEEKDATLIFFVYMMYLDKCYSHMVAFFIHKNYCESMEVEIKCVVHSNKHYRQ